MSKIYVPGDEERSSDSIKYHKDCFDFQCLNDGTITGEYRYCNFSNICRQIDIVDGKPVPMESNFLPIVNQITGEEIEQQLFCTGKHDLRPLKERYEDDKVN